MASGSASWVMSASNGGTRDAGPAIGNSPLLSVKTEMAVQVVGAMHNRHNRPTIVNRRRPVSPLHRWNRLASSLFSHVCCVLHGKNTDWLARPSRVCPDGEAR